MSGVLTNKHKHINWIRAALVAGVLLALLLVVQSIANYLYVVARLLPDHLAKQAERHVAVMEGVISELPRPAPDAEQQVLRSALEEVIKKEPSEIAWIRLIEERKPDPRGPVDGIVVAEAGDRQPERLRPVADVVRLFQNEPRSVVEDESFGPRSRLVVVAVPVRIRYQFPAQPASGSQEARPSLPAGSQANAPGATAAPQGGSGRQASEPGGTPSARRQPNDSAARFDSRQRSGQPGRFDSQRQPGATARGAGRAGTPQSAAAAGRPEPPSRTPGEVGPAPPQPPGGQAGAPAGPGRFFRRGEPRRFAEVALFLRGEGDPFTPLQRNIAISIAAAAALLAAVGLLYLRLPAYVRGRELEQQVSVARQVQQELFPSANAADDSLDFAAKCVPIWEVGGDYYDIFSTATGETALAVGDVSGKGLPAALLMALVHGAIRSGPNSVNQDHAQTVTDLNRMLCARLPGDRFVSLFWAYYEPGGRTLRYINAGHPPPLLFERGAKRRAVAPALSTWRPPEDDVSGARLLETGGPVLGLLREATYESESVTLHGGDLLVVYSDGLTEAWNQADEEFGEDRLYRTIARNLDRPADEIQRAVLDEVKSFVGSRRFEDDLTLLVVRFGEASSLANAAD